MAKIFKPNLSSTKVNIIPRTYSYGGDVKTVNTQDATQTASVTTQADYQFSDATANLDTGAVESKGFFSSIGDFIKNDVVPAVNDFMQEVEGKIKSILEKFGITDGEEEVEPSGGSETPTTPQTPTTPTEDKPSTTPEKPSKPEPESHPEEQVEPTTPSNGGANNSITQNLINKSDELVTKSDISTTVRTDCKQYGVSGDTNANHKASDGTLSAKEREMLIYLAYHETGDDPVQVTAVVSTFLNGWEKSGMSFNGYLAQACSQWSVGDDFYNATSSYRNGTYTYSDVTSMTKYKTMVNAGSYNQVSACVDNVLSGTRNVNSTQWQGGFYNKNGQLVNQFHVPA